MQQLVRLSFAAVAGSSNQPTAVFDSDQGALGTFEACSFQPKTVFDSDQGALGTF